MPPARALWERINREMRKRGITISEVHRATGLSRKTIYDLQERRPTADTVNTLAAFFGLDQDEAHRLAGLIPDSPDDEAADLRSEVEGALNELLDRLPESRRAFIARMRDEERARYDRLRADANAEYARAMARLEEIARFDAHEPQGDDEDAGEDDPERAYIGDHPV